jgi:uncharacterized protein
VNLIDSYSLDGFRLSTDTKVLGPCIILPNAVLKWVVSGPEDLTGQTISAASDATQRNANCTTSECLL